MSLLEGEGGSIELRIDLDGNQRIVRCLEVLRWSVSRARDMLDSSKPASENVKTYKRGHSSMSGTVECYIDLKQEYGKNSQDIFGFRQLNAILSLAGNGPETIQRLWLQLFKAPEGKIIDNSVTGSSYIMADVIIESVDTDFSASNGYVVFVFSFTSDSKPEYVVDANIVPVGVAP
jgi:hypothetical protein